MKKLILILIFGTLFADGELQNKYLSANINILSGSYASINYGNLTKGIEYNMSGIFSSEPNLFFKKTNNFQYQASIRQTIKKTTLGLIEKNNFIGYGIHLDGYYRKYDDGININDRYNNTLIGIELIYGTKLVYNINEQLGLEIHLPYISGQLDNISEIFSESKNYTTSLNFLNNALINLIFYY